MNDDWRPTANLSALKLRADALRTTREFFAARGVMEVETPALVNAPGSDVNLESIKAARSNSSDSWHFLHTSPEFAMKRLLASGSGDIYQLCKVFRAEERGRHHNPEFTMLEWYRLGFSLEQLMQEVAELVRALLGPNYSSLDAQYLTYREALQRFAGIDALESSIDDLRAAAHTLGMDPQHAAAATRDDLLDLIVGVKVGPALGQGRLTFIHRYPASQAALARLDSADPRVALRFELYYRGLELANGYHELASAAVQRRRFDQDQATRQSRGQVVHPLDQRFLAALDAGLPDCAGVALGFDRILMIACEAGSIDDVIAFPIERA